MYDSMGWNFALIDFVFSPDEADLIKSIPLSNFNQDDRIVWGVSTVVFIVLGVVVDYRLTPSIVSTMEIALCYDRSLNDDQLSFPDWLAWMFAHYPVCKRTEIVVVLWALWFSRNNLVHEGVVQRVSELIIFIRGYYSEIAEVVRGLAQPSSPQIVRWLPPPLSFVKSTYLLRSYNVYSGGPNCCSWATFTSEMGFRSIIIESDARAVICKLNATSEDLSEISAFICEATELSKWFLVCRFTYLARSGNWAMHTGAQEGISRREDGFWVEEAPVSATLVADEDKRLIDPP
ncbi:hypothetical protein CXB51_034381 [Gossypium anomalum]|uniref:RNase H type-1 domain-containing protein n=1 Tax=Gossypium anomalum TaxID=47600 RepID=A0A8J5Y1E4_9ROSI|nr:hypothetical protein CXB51_034381 [Gossypium anomalum]